MEIMFIIILNVLGENGFILWYFIFVIEKYILKKVVGISFFFRLESRLFVGFMRILYEIIDLKYSLNLELCFFLGSYEVGFM